MSEAGRLYVDDRYRGSHGIGRYAHEVTSRLGLPWSPLGLAGAPADPLDFTRRLPIAQRDGLIYSPGYGALLSARKQILTVHDLIHLKVDWPGRAKYLAYYNGPVRRVARRAGLLLTVSETSKLELQEWIRDDDVEVVNAGNGCSDAFRPEGRVHDGAPYVLYVGNLRKHKNLDTVLRAAAGLPEVELRAVLPKAEIPLARRKCAELGNLARVHFEHGLLDEELAALYRGAIATLMPSTLEGFGLPALESIMCGTPVLYWIGCAAVRETVGDRGSWVSDAADADAWRDLIAEFLADPRRVAPPEPEEYSWARAAASVTATLEGALR